MSDGHGSESLRTALRNEASFAMSCPSLVSGCALMPKYDLDAIDRRIVAALQADGRLANVDLADKIGLSPSPCLRRVKRLERDGYIEAYRAVLRRDRVGLGFSVFVGVKIDGHANERALGFEKAVVALPEVVACHLVSGDVRLLPRNRRPRSRPLPAVPGRQAPGSSHRPRSAQQHRHPDPESRCAAAARPSRSAAG